MKLFKVGKTHINLALAITFFEEQDVAGKEFITIHMSNDTRLVVSQPEDLMRLKAILKGQSG